MNKSLKRAGILVAVFVVALLVFSKTLNHEPKDMTTEMEAASLPVIYMLHDSVCLSELHGYVDEMDVTTMQDAVTVVPADNTLHLTIDGYDNEIKGLSYEVRSGDGSRLIEDGQDVELTYAEQSATAQLMLQDLLSLENEYLLVLQMDTGKQEIHYYTKLMKYEGFDTDACIAFVMEFHNKTLDKQAASSLGVYLEPSADADNTNLAHVTIENRLRQIYWDKLEVTEITAPVVTVIEANPDYNVMLLTTTVSALAEDGTLDYYNVKEYYKVRQGIERMYLLDYERQVEEIFQGTQEVVDKNHLLLGIRSQEVDYWSNETGTNVCFVQQGDLWSYNQNAHQLVCAFSFRQTEGMDIRDNYDQHDIRIIHADETGSVDFIVYGYMNRGEHEGKVGIRVCHYDSVTNTVEERLFLPFNQSYKTLQASISQLLYINDEDVFYLMLGDAIYAIDLESKKYKVFLDGLEDGACQVSADGRYVAWVEGTVNLANTMQIVDLNTGEQLSVAAQDGYYLKPMGFMDSDCIYGYAPVAGASQDLFAASSVKVASFTGKELVELTSYEKYGYWISDVEIDGGNIKLQLVKNGELEVTQTDTITNKEVQERKIAQVELYTTEMKQTQVRLSLAAENIPEKAPIIKNPKLMLSEKNTTLILEEALVHKGFDAVQ